jgi:ribosome-binding protein aMBF1 (putative translation factor)
MDREMKKRLVAAGFTVGTPQTLLDATDEQYELAKARADVGNAVRERRAASGETQAEFADRTGFSQSRVSRIERGVAGISLDVLLKAYFATGGRWEEIGSIVRREPKRAEAKRS